MLFICWSFTAISMAFREVDVVTKSSAVVCMFVSAGLRVLDVVAGMWRGMKFHNLSLGSASASSCVNHVLSTNLT